MKVKIAKVMCAFRLGEEVRAEIKRRRVEMECKSDAEVIERLLGFGAGAAAGMEDEEARVEDVKEEAGLGGLVVAPAGEEEEKRKRFEALKAKLMGSVGQRFEVEKVETVARIQVAGPSGNAEEVRPLSETPCAPFEVVLEGQRHKVARQGSQLGLFFVEGAETVFVRYLAEGEMEKLWAVREIR